MFRDDLTFLFITGLSSILDLVLLYKLDNIYFSSF